MMKPLYKLKWLSGILAGRELALPLGEIRLGGETPDIALPLELNAETLLIVNEQGIRLSQPVPLWVDGLPWETNELLPQKRVIDLAGLVFIFGDIEQPLPTLAIPLRRNKNKTHVVTLTIAIIFLFLVLLAIGISTDISPENEEPFDKVIWLEQQMKQPDHLGLQASFDNNGIIHLSGVSVSKNTIYQLQEQFAQFGFSFYNKSIDVSTLHNLVRQTLEMNGYHDIDITQGNSLDSVKIYGDIQFDNHWQQTQAQINQISLLKSWVVINDRSEEFKKTLHFLDSESLLEGLNISIENNKLLVSGKVPDKNLEKLNIIISDFNKSQKTRMKINYQNIPNKNIIDEFLPGKIISIGGNDEYIYLQLSNNMRLYKGSILPNGYKVYSLSMNTLMLIYKQNFLSIPINL
ncbi:EscD/YscD/HrpQ family type III secretion system inner membrane ring protein [Providencia rettgeri]|uniref:Type III secretion system inner membrane ring subunit SctD n=5 Tax=Providencia TaxID=586 RepID=A0AA42FQ92_9GAMM|nr:MULTISPECIES: type III secretion system inner membrane ring subunit SctD [Providencia]EIU9517050.1 type III secretion system inner membrane ring subunit SctD [Providencia rettgeri]EJD6411790.1 type III secretion system inner membrane ring subunit SctD [Providencia rettgeri]EJD6509530.1 type III secretion system inner membrane ring subunit SctD [Providencia rettgeri]EJD6663760.1 type III secretion system inner membrane ring subunit SctD [Providencia rettgeri]ELR5097383.1 type III secretion s